MDIRKLYESLSEEEKYFLSKLIKEDNLYKIRNDVKGWAIRNKKHLSTRIYNALHILAEEEPELNIEDIDKRLFVGQRNLSNKSWKEFENIRHNLCVEYPDQ